MAQAELILADSCPGCGAPWPEDLDRFALSDGRVYCLRCGAEFEVAEEEVEDDA
ncbi:hypothetical protein [Thermus sp.]|uniref:hypothetical protein n=1 Tax=Thermus sp. TaxID=275 RepID=UPI003D09FB5C